MAGSNASDAASGPTAVAAGVTDGSGVHKQTLTAAAQGAVAALSAYKWVSEHGHRCRVHERGFALEDEPAGAAAG